MKIINLFKNNIKNNPYLTIVENSIITSSLIANLDYDPSIEFDYIIKQSEKIDVSELMLYFLYVCYYSDLSFTHFHEELKENHNQLLFEVNKKDQDYNYELSKIIDKSKQLNKKDRVANIIRKRCDEFIWQIKRQNKHIKEKSLGIPLSEYVSYNAYNDSDFFNACKAAFHSFNYYCFLCMAYALKEINERLFVKLIKYIYKRRKNSYHLLTMIDEETFNLFKQ